MPVSPFAFSLLLFHNSQIHKHLKLSAIKSNWFHWAKLHFVCAQFSLTINFAFGSMMTKCQVIQDVIFSMKVFKINISVHFNWETFLSWAIHWNCIEHYLLPGLSNFVVNCFCYWTTESPSTLSLKRYHNLLIGKQPYMLMKVLQTYWSSH